jgi:hypothetical protein
MTFQGRQLHVSSYFLSLIDQGFVVVLDPCRN